MPETLGTLNLKIARLEQWLKVLEYQQAMSQAYPEYQAKLDQECARLKSQLLRLIQYRRHLLLTSQEIKTIN